MTSSRYSEFDGLRREQEARQSHTEEQEDFDAITALERATLNRGVTDDAVQPE